MYPGIWATLQFKWIQLQYPVVCLAFERLLFAATPPVAAMIFAWGTLTAVGPSHAPFYQAAVLSGEALSSLQPWPCLRTSADINRKVAHSCPW